MPPKRRLLELNQALTIVGSTGKFEITMFALLFIVGIFHGARITSAAFFLSFVPDHRCRIPGLHNDTYDVTDVYQQLRYNQTIPPDPADDPGRGCRVYNTSHNFTYDKYNRPKNGQDFEEGCTDGFVYDTSVMKLTVTSQLDFVCGESIDASHATMALMLGSLIGAVVFGYVSDRFGRKTCLLSSAVLFVGFGIGLTWSTNVILFCCLYFVVGAASTGMFAGAFVIGLELVKPSLRKYPGLIIQMFFTLGELVLAALAYGFRDWRWVNLTIVCPAVLIFFYYWCVPEALRWLMLHKRYVELDAILRRIARWNGKTLPPDWDEDEAIAGLLTSINTRVDDESYNEILSTQVDNFLDLFKNCKLFFRTVAILWNWFVVNLVFYGYLFSSAKLSDNLFLNFVLPVVVEIPAHFISLLLVDRIGRKAVHCAFTALVALASAAFIGVKVMVPDLHWACLLLTMLGKLGSAGFLGTSFLWMTELFPTSVRSTGLGVGSACARVGAMVVPYIIHAGTNISGPVGDALPYIVFCGATTLAFLADLTLPETNERDLPQSVEEAKEFGRCRTRTFVAEYERDSDTKSADCEPLLSANDMPRYDSTADLQNGTGEVDPYTAGEYSFVNGDVMSSTSQEALVGKSY